MNSYRNDPDGEANQKATRENEVATKVVITKAVTEKIPCPDCYGGHFRPCQLCGDSGVALRIVEQEEGATE